MRNRSVNRIFQRGVTLCQSEGTHQIVIVFSPPVAGCLPKKGLQKGDHGHPRSTPPSYALAKVPTDSPCTLITRDSLG